MIRDKSAADFWILLLTVYRLPFTIYRLPFTAYYPLPLTTFRLSFAVRLIGRIMIRDKSAADFWILLLTVYRLPFTIYRLPFTAYYPLLLTTFRLFFAFRFIGRNSIKFIGHIERKKT
jgi:hypothetical protein